MPRILQVALTDLKTRTGVYPSDTCTNCMVSTNVLIYDNVKSSCVCSCKSYIFEYDITSENEKKDNLVREKVNYRNILLLFRQK